MLQRYIELLESDQVRNYVINNQILRKPPEFGAVKVITDEIKALDAFNDGFNLELVHGCLASELLSLCGKISFPQQRPVYKLAVLAFFDYVNSLCEQQELPKLFILSKNQ